MKNDYKRVQYCSHEWRDGEYVLTSELLTEPNPDPEQMDKEGAAEDDHVKMKMASVESKTVTEKRKRGKS